MTEKTSNTNQDRGYTVELLSIDDLTVTVGDKGIAMATNEGIAVGSANEAASRVDKYEKFIKDHVLDGLCPFVKSTGEYEFSSHGCECCSPGLGNDVTECTTSDGRTFSMCHACMIFITYGEE